MIFSSDSRVKDSFFPKPSFFWIQGSGSQAALLARAMETSFPYRKWIPFPILQGLPEGKKSKQAGDLRTGIHLSR